MPAIEENAIKRILPHSIEADQSVIGSMIMDREAIVVASEMIMGDDFYNKQYGILFETMVELNDQGSAVDLVTLQNRLREKDVPPEVSSFEFVRDLIMTVPTSANIKYYANIVAEKATLRKLIRLNEVAAQMLHQKAGENHHFYPAHHIEIRNGLQIVPLHAVPCQSQQPLVPMVAADGLLQPLLPCVGEDFQSLIKLEQLGDVTFLCQLMGKGEGLGFVPRAVLTIQQCLGLIAV